jgi:LmbE family N-acetylglucosaminyl deacetylase
MTDFKQLLLTGDTYLFVTAHPDDVDVFFGGTIAMLRSLGKEIYILLVTNGARGSRENHISEHELSEVRLEEEKSAMLELGVDRDHVFTLGYKDGEVENNIKLIGEIAYYIRKFKPYLVGAHDPSYIYNSTNSAEGHYVQHRDHRNSGSAAVDAVYPFSRDRSFFLEHEAEGLEPHSVYKMLLADAPQHNLEVDITDFASKKRTAMLHHKSQFNKESVDEIFAAFKNKEGRDTESFQFLNLIW